MLTRRSRKEGVISPNDADTSSKMKRTLSKGKRSATPSKVKRSATPSKNKRATTPRRSKSKSVERKIRTRSKTDNKNESLPHIVLERVDILNKSTENMKDIKSNY